MPNCKYIKSIFDDVIDGAVGEETLSSFNSHICVCRQCNLRYNKMLRMVENVRSLPKADLPNNFHEILMSKVEIRRKHRKLLPMRFNLKYISAASVVVCLISFVSALIFSSPVKKLGLFAFENNASEKNKNVSVDFIAGAGVSGAADDITQDVGSTQSQKNTDSYSTDGQNNIIDNYNNYGSQNGILDSNSQNTSDEQNNKPQNTLSSYNDNKTSAVSPVSTPSPTPKNTTIANNVIASAKPIVSSAPVNQNSGANTGSSSSSSETKDSPENSQNAQVLSSMRNSGRTTLVAESVLNQDNISGKITILDSFTEYGVDKIVVNSSDFDRISELKTSESSDTNYIFVIESIN